jgi:hypothetical protein
MTAVYWVVTSVAGLAALVLTVYNVRNWIGKGTYLCEDCRFNSKENCERQDRPKAVDCTSYRPLGS